MIENGAWLTQKFMLDALKQAKLPCTYMTLLSYEASGIINKPAKMLEINGKPWRFYTPQEIKENVEKVRAYKKRGPN